MRSKLILFISLFVMANKNVSSQNWVAVGGGFDAQAIDLFFDSVTNKLFASGNFIHAGGHVANGVAAWDGQNWDTLNGGMYPQIGRFCTRFNGELYCFGLFTKSNGINGIVTNGMATWNGSSWDSVCSGFNPLGPADYLIDNNLLYITGTFATANNTLSSSIVAWDGTNFIPMGIPHAAINNGGSPTIFNGNLYMAGSFADSSYSLYHLAYWDGTQWHQVSTTIDGYFLSMAVYHGELYLSGWGITGPGNNIIKYDGTNFTGVGGDLDGYAYKMKIIDDRLFVVGSFYTAGGIFCPSHMAIWDGISWSPFTNDTFSSGVGDFEIYNDELYVTGGFITINSDTVGCIAKYTGPLTTADFAKPSLNFYLSHNPSNSFLNVSLSSPLMDDAVLITIDARGREQFRILIPRQTMRKELDISELAAGIYFVTLESENGRVTKKFIKE